MKDNYLEKEFNKFNLETEMGKYQISNQSMKID